MDPKSLFIFIIIPFNFVFIKIVLLSIYNNTNLIIFNTFFFIFNHLFFSIMPQRNKIYSVILSFFTNFLYLIFSFSSLVIDFTNINSKYFLILQHFVINIPVYILYNLLNKKI